MNLASINQGRAAYVAMRKRGLGASAAKSHAIMALEAGRKFYGPEKPGAIWAPDSEGRGAGAAIREGRKLWIENPAALGLRFVGFSDELPGGPGHSGWFVDPDDQSEVCRGAVWQWPARNGESRDVYGYREGSTSRRRGGAWQDSAYLNDAGAGLLFFGDIVKGDKGGRELSRYPANDESLRDCARWADSEAEAAAEKQREWQEAYAIGREAAESLNEAQEARRAALALIREAKGACQPIAALGPALRAALGQSIREHVEAWQEAKAKAAAAWADIPSSLESAFLEGAGRERGGLFGKPASASREA